MKVVANVVVDERNVVLVVLEVRVLEVDEVVLVRSESEFYPFPTDRGGEWLVAIARMLEPYLS